MQTTVDIITSLESESHSLKLPLYLNRVPAGFPSPSDEVSEGSLDLNAYLIPKPVSTFLVRASGHSMEGAGIFSGDLLVVDRSQKPTHRKIVVVALNGELMVKRLSVVKEKVSLLSEHADYPPVEMGAMEDLVVWGVVTFVIHDPT